jgi:hypothetical protein
VHAHHVGQYFFVGFHLAEDFFLFSFFMLKRGYHFQIFVMVIHDIPGVCLFIVHVHKINSLRVVTSFFACKMFVKVNFPSLIGKLGQLLLFPVCRVTVIPTSIVWYATSQAKILSEMYLGNRCGGSITIVDMNIGITFLQVPICNFLQGF